jgi:hypothetical protein
MADRSSRLLERALLFTFVIHGVAMGSMALVLLPGMPGGGTSDLGARLHYLAGHPWLWRLGWFPGQLTALSDLLIAIGLLRAWWVQTRQEIFLEIPIEACEPLEGRVSSRAASAIVGEARPFFFRIASVRFRFDREEHDPL